MTLPGGISMRHLDRMTDCTGLVQHAIYSVPRRESGYTIDDNARALLLCVRLWSYEPSPRMLERVVNYLSLLEFAKRPGGGFYNLMSYQRQWLDTDSSGDCQGQAVRALADVVASGLSSDLRHLAVELMQRALPTLAELRSLRAQAYVVIAFGRLRGIEHDLVPRMEAIARGAARHLVECFERSRRPGWEWFESRMTYANAVLPHALFVAERSWPDRGFGAIAAASFAFLEAHTTNAGLFEPVGSNGWYSHGETKARYDQQPVEAVTMADAALAGFQLSCKDSYLSALRRAHAWFGGGNSEGLNLGVERDGACYDALMPGRVNRNQGAESTLAFLWTSVILAEGEMVRRQYGMVPLEDDTACVPAFEEASLPAAGPGPATEEPTRG
ncbi:MAG: hypothetical protein K2Y21_08890 [Phycisphaerales bacterium]|nr:hypothetical protein [Phycisphaerales bacterium]